MTYHVLRGFLRVVLTVLCVGSSLAPALAQSEASQAASVETEQPATDYSAIADLLEDEAARTALIDELRRLAGGSATPAEAAVTQPPEGVSVAARIAAVTHHTAELIVAELGDLYRQITVFDRTALSQQAVAEFGAALAQLLAVVLVVAVAVWILRRLAARVYSRASAWVENGAGGRLWLRRGAAALSCGALDFAIVLVGWLIGYVAALFLLGEGGRMDTRQSLFLNAFLVVETFRVVVRLLFANRYDGLRLLPVDAEDAAYWNAWLSRLSGFVGYGILVVAPITVTHLGAAAGYLVSASIYGLALVAAIAIVRQNRAAFSRRLSAMAERSGVGFVKLAMGMLARIWHLIAFVYLTSFAILMLVRPEAALGFMLGATLQTIGALLLGTLLSAVIDRGVAMGIKVTSGMRTRFPGLEARLNAFVPGTLKVVRFVIAIIVLAVIIDAWAIFDVFAWASSETGAHLLGTVATVGLILATAFGLWLLVSSWIEHRLNLGIDGNSVAASAREKTLLSIFRNAFTISLIVIVVMIVLSELGLDIGPLLAGAGVLGLAIGFGAQKLVQDVINGIFIQLENTMNTGDVVTAGGMTGVVESLTVRSVGIRDLSGTYHLIPFSSVDTVSNFMRGFGYHVGEYRVAYRENVDDMIGILRAAFEDLRGDPEQSPFILGDLEVHGVTEFADSSVTVRVRIKALPGYQWPVGRAYNGLVKKHLDASGIKIPYPHLTLNVGNREASGAIDGAAAGKRRKTSSAPAPKAKRRGPRKQDIPSESEVDR